MSPCRSNPTLVASRCRAGLTLVELLSAVAILAVIGLAMGTLSMTIQQGSEYSSGRLEAAQHARVVIDRIQRTLRDAHASEQFPGFYIATSASTYYSSPDTIAIWSPEGEPANPDGMPLWSELIIYYPDNNAPNRLLELVDRTATTQVPSLDDPSIWQIQLAQFKASGTTTKTELTNLVRESVIEYSGYVYAKGSTVRFHQRHLPSKDELYYYRYGAAQWDNLPWVQDIRGSQTGLRQSWCSFEIQLMPGEDAAENPSREAAIPFFGSGALYYEIKK